jgi:hypothetical protein
VGLRAAVLTLVTCASWAATAAAEPLATLEVERGSGAEECPDAPALARRVGELEPSASIATDASEPAKLRLRVRLERHPEHWRAQIQVSGARTGERTLTDSGAQCSGLGEAVALTIAMLLQVDAQAEPEPAPVVAEPSPPPKTPPAAAPRRASRAAGPPALGLELSLGPAMTAGVLERIGVAVLGEVELGVTRSFHVGLGGLWALPQTIEHGEGQVEVSLLALTLSACLDLFGEKAAVELAACAIQAGGELRGTGHGYSAYTDSAGRPWLAFGGGARARGNIVGPLGYLLGLSLLVPLSEQRFAVEGVSGTAFEPSPVAIVAGAALRVSIW